MNQREVAHRWAQNNGGQAKSGAAMYYENETIYSYGAHFILARHMPGNVILFNSSGYSVSTSKHQSYTRQAIDYDKHVIFNVPECVWPYEAKLYKQHHTANVASYADRIKEAFEQAGRSRKYKAMYLQQAGSLMTEARAYVAHFRCKGVCKAEAKRLIFNTEAVEGSAAEIAEAAKTEQQRRTKSIQVKVNKALKPWRAGETDYLPHRNDVTGEYLRVTASGQIETSQGIKIEMDEGRRIFGMIQKVKASGQPWKANGQRITIGQYYQMDWIKPNGDIKAGCHMIKGAELNKFAAAQGWI